MQAFLCGCDASLFRMTQKLLLNQRSGILSEQVSLYAAAGTQTEHHAFVIQVFLCHRSMRIRNVSFVSCCIPRMYSSKLSGFQLRIFLI